MLLLCITKYIDWRDRPIITSSDSMAANFFMVQILYLMKYWWSIHKQVQKVYNIDPVLRQLLYDISA